MSDDLFNGITNRLSDAEPQPDHLLPSVSRRLGDEKQTGVTPLDIMDLPRAQQQIMTFLLRDQRAALEGATLDELQARFNTAQNIPETLAALSKNGWLILLGEPPGVRYKINLRRKRGGSPGLFSKVLDRLSDDSDKPAADSGIFKRL